MLALITVQKVSIIIFFSKQILWVPASRAHDVRMVNAGRPHALLKKLEFFVSIRNLNNFSVLFTVKRRVQKIRQSKLSPDQA